MAAEEGNEDDAPRTSGPLPPDDRLWRHPSELAGGTPAPSAWSTSAPAPTAAPRRGMAIAALASACLAGAVVAVGVMWVARPTRVVHDQAAVRTSAPRAAASFASTQISTAGLADRLGPSLVRVQVGRSDQWADGTGVWLDDGAVLVATPLLGGNPTDAITVSRDGAPPATATVVGSDAVTGISVLRVPSGDGTPLAASTASPEVGTSVAVIGAARPTTGSGSAPRAVTAAIGTVGERVDVPPLVLHDALLLDRQVPADALGALVVDGKGRIVGVVVSTSGKDGLAVVAPAHDAMAAARDLRTDGVVRRAWLGVRAVDLSQAEARLLDLQGGARLTQVTPGSPAAAAGLQPGDVITHLDGHEILDASDLVMALQRWSPGEQVQVHWQRGASPHAARCTLGG